MISLNEIIECSSYADIPDMFHWGHFRGQHITEAPPDNSLVYCAIDDCAAFFASHGNNGRNYTLVSACSDFGLAEQSEYPWYEDCLNNLRYRFSTMGTQYFSADVNPALFNAVHFVDSRCNSSHKFSVRSTSKTWYTFDEIPLNIKSWHQTNLQYWDDSRLCGLPFGVAEGTKETLYKVMRDTELLNKKDLIYCNFGQTTHERSAILHNLNKLNNPKLTIRENVPHEEYLREMAAHKYVLCPSGQGLDTYRFAEAIYLGCTPIIDINSYDLIRIFKKFDYNAIRLPIVYMLTMNNETISEIISGGRSRLYMPTLSDITIMLSESKERH